MGGSRIIQLGMCPCRFCAECFGSVGAALTSCAFGKSWDLHSQGSPQQWQCGVHGSLHLSEYVQVWDCLRQMIDAEGRKLLIEEYIFVKKYKPQCQHMGVCNACQFCMSVFPNC